MSKAPTRPNDDPGAASRAEEAATAGPALGLYDFWYIACESRELGPKDVLKRCVLDEDIVVFRDREQKPVILRDRCMHRAAPLSGGQVHEGCLRCGYHGWTYDRDGEVVAVPCERDNFKRGGVKRRAVVHEACEQDDFVYVRLRARCPSSTALLGPGPSDITPFAMPKYRAQGYATVRLQNRFRNNVTNCAENFIDIPHTVFVHPSIFRTSRGQKISATVERRAGNVHVNYQGETDNLGWFRWFLNPRAEPIVHVDNFFMPNVTCVEYAFGPRRHFFITSQSVPVHDDETLVYTDLTFDYGIWNMVAKPLVAWQGQKVIDQDLDILSDQMDVIRKTGDDFAHTQADTIHLFVESIRDALMRGQDPRALPDQRREITFWI